jgi:hypothetical protein
MNLVNQSSLQALLSGMRATEQKYLDAMRYAQDSFDRELSSRGIKED